MTPLEQQIRSALDNSAAPLDVRPGWTTRTIAAAERNARKRRIMRPTIAVAAAGAVVAGGLVVHPFLDNDRQPAIAGRTASASPTTPVVAPGSGIPQVPFVSRADGVPPGDTLYFGGHTWSPGDQINYPIAQINNNQVIASVGAMNFWATKLVLHTNGGRDVTLGTFTTKESVGELVISPDGSIAAWSTDRGSYTELTAVALPSGKKLSSTRASSGSGHWIVGFIDNSSVAVSRNATEEPQALVYRWNTRTGETGPALTSQMTSNDSSPALNLAADTSAVTHGLLTTVEDNTSSCISAYSVGNTSPRWHVCVPGAQMFPRFNQDGTRVAVTWRRASTVGITILDAVDGHVIAEGNISLRESLPQSVEPRPIWESDGSLLVRYEGDENASRTVRCRPDLKSCVDVTFPVKVTNVTAFGSLPGQGSMFGDMQ